MARNANQYTGQPSKPKPDRAELTAPVIGPVDTGGWYECRDGSSAHFEWIGGRLTLLGVKPPDTTPADYELAEHVGNLIDLD